MASEVKLKIMLPDRAMLERIENDDIVTRYIKSDYMSYTSDFAYYDTPRWDLCENGFLLRVCTSGAGNAATLRCGSVDQRDNPGLYTGQGWLAYFTSADTIAEEFARRGAHSQFSDYASRGELAVRFTATRARARTNLYLPERTRVDIAFDDGSLTADGKSETIRQIALTLSYGDVGMFTNYCKQLMSEFSLSPDLLTTAQKALRLRNSR